MKKRGMVEPTLSPIRELFMKNNITIPNKKAGVNATPAEPRQLKTK